MSSVEPNDVITQAQPLGTVDIGQVANVYGTIGDDAYGGADVDWVRINVDQTEKLTLTLNGAGVVSLYDNDSSIVPFGHQLILQFNAAGLATVESIDVLPGVYEVAVSGLGNRYFSPVLPNSGSVGLPGPYILTLAGGKPDFDTTTLLPVVRTDMPAGGYIGAPLAINVYLSQPIDLTQDYVTILDAFQDDLMPVVTFNSDTKDLVLNPQPALTAGQYQIVAFDSNGNQLLAIPFNVLGTPTTDTLATAGQIGDITNGGLVQLPGVIGNDPYYSPYNSDPTATNPASQVNMYSFTVSGPGVHVLSAEAFAGRIGSPLNAALTLFRVTGVNPDGTLAWQLIAGNDNTYNPSVGSDGKQWLYPDPALFADLTAGRYVVAVSSMPNYADPLLGIQPGVNGVFDPNQSHSGSAGQTTGNYVLNLLVQPGATTPPRVTQISVQPGAVLNGPPTQFTVRFSAPMDLVQLAVASGQQFQGEVGSGNLDPALLARFPCYIQDATGNRYFIGLASYDSSTGVATFTVLERLISGQYFLRLSGPNGLADLAGNPLVGNSVSGDYVVPFTVVNSPARSATMQLTDANDSARTPTDLGILFPDELAAGVGVQRDFRNVSPAPADQANYYRFTLLHDTTLDLSLGGAGLNVPGRPVLLDANGNPLYPAVDPTDPTAQSVIVLLHAGTYTVMVGTWPPSDAGQVVYTLAIRSIGMPENPTPLTTSPAPAYRLQLDSSAGPAGTSSLPSLPATTPTVTLPSQGTPSVLLTVDRGAGGAVPSGNALSGAASALAAGPAGVVSSTSASNNDTARLVLPGTEFPSTSAVTTTKPDVPANASAAGAAVETTLRTILFYTFQWLQLSPLIPPSLLQEGEPEPVEPADPDQALAPANEAPPVAADAHPLDAVAAAGLVLVGGMFREGEERNKRSLSW